MRSSLDCNFATAHVVNIGRTGRTAPICDLHAGETCFHDLERDPIVLLDKPFHSVNFYLPRATFDAIAEDVDVPPIGDLNYKPGTGVADGTIANRCAA